MASPGIPDLRRLWRQYPGLLTLGLAAQMYRCGLRGLPSYLTALTSLGLLQVDGFGGLSSSIDIPSNLSELSTLHRLSLSGWTLEEIPPVGSPSTLLFPA